MPRIDDIFARLRREGRTALMPFITGGHPTLDATRRILPVLERAGASIVEVGIPFSDPIADGPVIASSMHEVLTSGTTVSDVLEAVRTVRPSVSLGLIAMVSESIVMRRGEAVFVDLAADAGFDGLIVPDADTEAGTDCPAAELARLARDRGLTCTFLIAPTTSEDRIASITSLCTGFVYLLARVGITGERDAPPEIAERVQLVRRHTDLPIAVGFGISRPDHVAAVTRTADAAIVGSALVRRMGEAEDPVEAGGAFVTELAAGLSTRAAVS